MAHRLGQNAHSFVETLYMTTLPMISVIIPAHNQERYIGRCLRSILNQSYPRDKYEIIVIDDCSKDRTDYALELFANEIVLLRNEEQLGLPGSLNRGIHAARGRYVIRLDADDYVHFEYLNALSLHLDLNGHFDAVACDYITVDDHENVLEQVNCMEKPIGCGILFRMDQLIDIGLYDETFLRREEEELRIRFLQRYSIERCALPLYRYRKHEDNITNDDHAMHTFGEKLANKHNT